MYLSPVFYFLDFIMPENGSVGKNFYMFYSDNKEVISMKQVERYFYPAVFTYEPGQEIAVDFPDLKCATSGVNDDDALLSARELLGCVLYGLEEDAEEIPAPTPLTEVDTQPNERVQGENSYFGMKNLSAVPALNRFKYILCYCLSSCGYS